MKAIAYVLFAMVAVIESVDTRTWAADQKAKADPEYDAFSATVTDSQKKRMAAIEAEFEPRLSEIAKRIRELKKSREPSRSLVDPFGPNAKPLTKEEQTASMSYQEALFDLERQENDIRTDRILKKWAVYTSEQRTFLSVRALKSEGTIEFVDAPLKEVLAYFRDLHHIPISIDDSAAGVVANDKTLLSMIAKHLTLDSGMRLTLEQAGLAHILHDGSIVVATKDAAKKYLAQGATDPAPLIAPFKAVRMQEIEKRLAQPVNYQCTSKDLRDVLNELGGKNNDFAIDSHSIEKTYIGFTEPKITVDLKNTTLKDGLTKILAPAGLVYKVRDEKIVIVGLGEARRTWTDSGGRHSIEAELVDASGDNVRLRKADGRIITIARSRLSDADRKFLAERAAAGSGAAQGR